MAVYLTAAGHPAAQAVAVFGDWPLLVAQLAHLVYAGLYGAVWAVAWRGDRSGQTLGLGAALILLSVPPLGTLYFGSPLMAAGVLFPSAGLFGLAAFWVLVSALLCAIRPDVFAPRIITRWARLVVATLITWSAWLNLHASDAEYLRPTAGLQIEAVPTQLSAYPAASIERYQRQFELLGLARAQIQKIELTGSGDGLHLVLLPEGVAGLREPRVNWLWDELADEAAAANVVIAVGNSQELKQPTGSPGQLVNQLHLLGAASGQLRALANVPIGSWKPWAESGHYPVRWLAKVDQVPIAGHTLGAVLCWEELIIWPWLRHAGAGTTMVLVASNTWFNGGSIDFAQRRATWAMSRLFDIRVARAGNTAAAGQQPISVEGPSVVP